MVQIFSTIIKNNYIYKIGAVKITFLGPTKTINLKMCNDVKDEYKNVETCEIKDLPKYLTTDINVIGLICSFHTKYVLKDKD